MSISAIYNVKGGTLAQYNQIIEALGKHVPAPGGLAHIATATPEGFLVCDVWESQEAFDNFSAILGPAAAAAGIGNQDAPLMGRVVNMFVTDKAAEVPSVAILYSFPGMSVDRYRDVLGQVKFEGLPPTARRAHIASETAEGIVVVAVWEKELAFREFEPALREAFTATGVDKAVPVVGQIHRIAFSPDVVQTAPA